MAIYLKIDGIEGECEKKDHEGWIECKNWSWGIMNQSSAQHGTGLSAGTVSFHDINVTCVSGGKTSLLLLHFLSIGKHLTEICLDLTKAIGDNPEGIWYQLSSTSAMITSVNVMGTSEAGASQDDMVTIAVANYKHEIWSQDDTGALSTEGDHGFDIKTNEAT